MAEKKTGFPDWEKCDLFQEENEGIRKPWWQGDGRNGVRLGGLSLIPPLSHWYCKGNPIGVTSA